MQKKIEIDARKRMSRLLLTPEAQKKMDRLKTDKAEFCADVMGAVSRTGETALLDETEVFAVCELAARLGIRTGVVPNGARLDYEKGRAVLTVDFACLSDACRRLGL